MTADNYRQLYSAARSANDAMLGELAQTQQALEAAIRYITKLERDNARLAKLNEVAGQLLAERGAA
jgi:hypothetical protein